MLTPQLLSTVYKEKMFTNGIEDELKAPEKPSLVIIVIEDLVFLAFKTDVSQKDTLSGK